MKEIIAEKEKMCNLIQKNREEIADLKKERIELRASLWDEATGTVDQKKDFLRSKTSELDHQIAYKEAYIEYCYNCIEVLNDRMVFDDE